MFKIFKDINERSKLDDKEKEQNEGKTRGYSMDQFNVKQQKSIFEKIQRREQKKQTIGSMSSFKKI